MKIRCRIIPLWLVFIVSMSSADERAQPSVNTKAGVETYEYNWEALKTHPVPAWYDEAKFGIFIHWGPSSVPGHIKGGKGYAEWMPRRMYEDPEYYDPYLEEHFDGHPPEFGYKDFIPRFKAENWDPDDWAELFDRAGAKYVVLTAEHHDGYAMWDSELTPWSATKTGPMRDLVGDLGKAVRKRGSKYAPSYHRERHTFYFASGGYRQKNTPFPDIAEEIKRVPEAAGLYGPFEISDAFIEDYVARWKEIEEKYRPDLMWIDHIPFFHEKWCRDFNLPQIEKYQTACMKMIADYFNAAEGWGKEVYVNNKGPNGLHNWPLGVGFREADNLKLKDISTKWQNPATLGTSYGYMKWEEENDAYKSPTELIHLLCDVVSKNGNLLLNIGPRADGTIPQGMRERLLAIGQWLETNGDAIYGTRPWRVASQEMPDLRFTTKGDTLFAIALEQPAGPFVIRNSTGQPGLNVSEVSLLGSDQMIEWRTVDTGLEIIPPSNMPGKHAWTFRIQTNDESSVDRDGAEPGAAAPFELPIRVEREMVLGSDGVSRRDPSDVIKVGDTYYLWYTKVVKADLWDPEEEHYPHGYPGDIWYATSTDGRQWEEQGEAIAKGGRNDFDGHGVFTPNILVADGKYYLFYTAVDEPYVWEKTPTTIGVAVSDSPDGPWEKYDGNPVLSPSPSQSKFDSHRVDDVAFIVRNGQYWMYYKGRPSRETKGWAHTKMGLAIADHPLGPYEKYKDAHGLHPVHEVLVWPIHGGVASFNVFERKVYFAPDGLAFKLVGEMPGMWAPGLYRSDHFRDGVGMRPEWGITLGKGVKDGLELGRSDWKFKIQTEAKAVKTPNILILYADDMGYGDLAIQNPDSKIPTPNLDRLAREGMRFTDGHSSSGVCTPSRYALLTGRHHWRKFHGIVNSFGPSSFDRERLTLPEMLQEKGYATAHIGKWHLGFDWSALLKPGRKLADPKGKAGTPYDAFDWSKKIPDGPTAHGFDYSFTDAVINFPPYTWIENDRVVEAPDTMMDKSKWKPIKEGHWECRPGPMVTGWNPYDSLPVLTRKGVSYIEAQAGSEKPFFLFFAFPSPHAPIIPNDVFDGASQAGAYGDFMVETDDVCGQLLRALEENGFSENTLVVFSSDNGAEHYLVRRYLDYGHSSSGPFRGMKQDIYEGGHRVPFLVKWPGITQPGSVSDALISQIDIMRTLAVQLDCPIPEGQAEDSLDMMPVLRQEQASVRKALVYNTWSKKYGMREGDWVYLTNTWERKRSDAYDEAANFSAIQAKTGLFNLNDDIGQRNNLVEQYPERAEHLKNLLNQVR